jgi:hypothetical protein
MSKLNISCRQTIMHSDEKIESTDTNHKDGCKSIAHTFSHMIDLEYVILEMKSAVAQ